MNRVVGFTYGLGESTGLSALETKMGAVAIVPEAEVGADAEVGVEAVFVDFLGVVFTSLVFAGEADDTADFSVSTTGGGAVAVSVAIMQDTTWVDVTVEKSYMSATLLEVVNRVESECGQR
jgi:hypothetical protein